MNEFKGTLEKVSGKTLTFQVGTKKVSLPVHPLKLQIIDYALININEWFHVSVENGKIHKLETASDRWKEGLK